MNDKITKIKKEIDGYLIESKQHLEDFRIKFLGSKGVVKQLFGELKAVPNEEKRTVGQLLNGLREFAQGTFDLSLIHISEPTRPY